MVQQQSPVRIEHKCALVIGFGAAARGYAALILRKNLLDPVFCLTHSRWKWWSQEANEPTSYHIYRVERDWRTVSRESFRNANVIPCYKNGTENAPSEEILRDGRSANIIVTAVGPSNLCSLDEVLAGIIVDRYNKSIKDPLHIVLIENLTVSGEEVTLLKEKVIQAAGPGFTQYVDNHVGFADTVVETTIMANEDDLDLTADRLDETLYIDASGVKGDILGDQTKLVKDIIPMRMRKLFIHNFADTAVAYLGAKYGHDYLHEAIEDPRISPILDGALREIRKALSREFPDESSMKEKSLKAYSDEQKERIRSTVMKDKVSRVARDPLRKLHADDRFFGPARLAKKHNIDPINLMECIYATIEYWYKERQCSAQSANSV